MELPDKEISALSLPAELAALKIEQDLSKILASVNFADKIIFGRTNYSREVTACANRKDFYNACAVRVKEFCRANNIACHIKAGTIT